MQKPPIKNNPAFLSDEELAEAFVVRHADLDMIVQVIHENTGEANQHVLVIGPRGIGKTMLVQRVALAVRQDDVLSKKWYPLIFAEESYEVGSAGEFWLEALFHLARQTKDKTWHDTYEDLKGEPVEDRLRERALAQFMDFADTQGKRILLIVENLNMLLGDQITDDDAWKLRHTLMHDPRVMLLATAHSTFDAVQNSGKPMFELLKFHQLPPLDDAECEKVWASCVGKRPAGRHGHFLGGLTGGNPRLVATLSRLQLSSSAEELMSDVASIVDELTDCVKHELDALPPTERRVHVALAQKWAPATAREVAQASRLGVSKTSALLQRLVRRGAIVEAGRTGRAKYYRTAEPMLCIYYLMRHGGGTSGRLEALIRFMLAFYGEAESDPMAETVAEEGGIYDIQVRPEHDDGPETLKTAYVLLHAERAADAVKLATALFADRDFTKNNIDDMVTLLAELVAANCAREACRILGNSESAAVLEPALVALQMFLGDEVHVAVEIVKVAKDVLKRFEEAHERKLAERAGQT